MRSLAQLVPLLFVLFCFAARGNIRKFFILAAIVTLPLGTTYAIGASVHVGWVSGFVVSISDVFFLLFAANTWLRGSVQPEPLSADPVARALVIFAVAGVVSMVNTVSKPLTLFMVIMLIQILLINYLCVVRCVNDQEDLDAVLQGISLSLIIQGGIGCLQFVRQDNFLWFSTGGSSGQTIMVGDLDSDSSLIRVFGTVGKPNGYAMVLAPLLLINIALVPLKELSGRVLRLLSIPIGLLGLIFCGSRGGWLSFSVALLAYMAFVIWKLEGRRLQAIGGVVLFLTFAAIAGGPFITKRLESDDRNAAGSRVPLVDIAMEMIKAHPVVGVGANTYLNVVTRYLPKNWDEHTWIGQVHNTYLLVLAEMGVIGFAAGFILMRSLVRDALASFRSSDSRLQQALGLGLLLVLVHVLVHSIVESYIAKMMIGSLLTLTGMVAAARRFDV